MKVFPWAAPFLMSMSIISGCTIIDNLDVRKDLYDDKVMGSIPDSLDFFIGVNEDSCYLHVNNTGHFSLKYHIVTSNNDSGSGIWNATTSTLPLFFKTPESIDLRFYDDSNDSIAFHFDVDVEWLSEPFKENDSNNVLLNRPVGISDSANVSICFFDDECSAYIFADTVLVVDERSFISNIIVHVDFLSEGNVIVPNVSKLGFYLSRYEYRYRTESGQHAYCEFDKDCIRF